MGENWQKALRLLAEMRKVGIILGASSYNAAISACRNAGQWQRSLELLRAVRKVGNED